jgi:hypothetical protein
VLVLSTHADRKAAAQQIDPKAGAERLLPDPGDAALAVALRPSRNTAQRSDRLCASVGTAGRRASARCCV